MRSVCTQEVDPFSWTMNQFPLNRAVAVICDAVSTQVIVDALVWVVAPFARMANLGSVLLAGGIGVGFKQGIALITVTFPLITVSPGCVDVFVLSQVWFVGEGKVAPTNRL